MKAFFNHLFILPSLISFILVGRVTAQTFTTLHHFTALSNSTNSDGANTQADLILSSNILYGTAVGGGSSGFGTVFAVNIDGTGFTNLHSFTGLDGANPYAGLILSSNTLYGTTQEGGSFGAGTVFAVNTDGTGFTILHNFNSGSDGATPRAGLILSGNILYGTASNGGNSGKGTVFAINTDGTGFTNLHNFNGGSDGANPRSELILSGNTLFGTAFNGSGTVYAVNTNATGFTVLHTFTFNDGANPYAGLVLSGNTLYGTATRGGGVGTVFAVNTNGTGFTDLHAFTGGDGASPSAGLRLSGNTLYGTTAGGGSSGNGTVFAVNIDGTGFTNLYNFNATSSPFYTNTSGARPAAGLILSGNTLYGTANEGGDSGKGAVFSLSLPPPRLTIIPFAENVTLTWPTYAPGITLQSTTNLVSPVVWDTVSPAPVLVNGRNAVTNPISGKQNFYRLSQE